jgi:hypothetical protein
MTGSMFGERLKRVRFVFSKFLEFFWFILFPARLGASRINASKDEYCLLDIREKGLPLIISFAGLGTEYNFKRTLADMDIETNVVYIRDLTHQWYLNDLPGVGSGVDEIARFLKKLIDEVKPSKVVCLGASAGGFAAILYGVLIGANRIIGFSPQTFMTKIGCVRHLDYRWLDRVIQINESGAIRDRKYHDLKGIVIGYQGWISIFYDPLHRLDRVHAERIKEAELCALKGKGHDLVRYLRDSGELRQFIRVSVLDNKL